ncbi:MAG: TIGR02757 family protein [Myxococcota bacterium]
MTAHGHNQAFRRRPRSARELREALDGLLARVNPEALVAEDPVSLVHRYPDPHDQEVAGLVVAGLAYGRVASIRDKAREALDRLGARPARSVDRGEVTALRGFVYRFQRGEDLVRLATAIGALRARHGSLGQAFSELRRPEDLDHADTASRWVGALREAMNPPLTYGARYLLPDPGSGGASKRLLLYLRWMIRGPDGLDLGAWGRALAPSLRPDRLVIPIDTHISRLARYLGLTERRADDLTTAREITTGLARLCAEDPIRYDMALCHLGISGACPRELEPAKCGACPLWDVCRVRPRSR